MKSMKQALFYFLILTAIFVSCKDPESIENRKAIWIEDAFTTIKSEEYSRIYAISWWHENFDNTKLRIDSSPESLSAYQNGVKSLDIQNECSFNNKKLLPPTQNKIYHSAFPDFGGTEDIVNTQSITGFENLAKESIAWAYFSNNWVNSIEFPQSEVNTIKNAGKIPFIRMMPRSNFESNQADPIYSMQKIIDGEFDSELTQWALDAKEYEYPLLVEFGTEVNGDWFSWNGKYNGGGVTTEYGDTELADGPERFRDAYRHIIDLFNENEVENITWFFHIDAYSSPEVDWNIINNYYPGDEYIDWLGVSIYGAQEEDEKYTSFSEIISDIYPALSSLSNKPIAILEFGVTE